MIENLVKKYSLMLVLLSFAQTILSAEVESIVMDAPSGSKLISSNHENGIETYSYRIYDHSVFGENGTLIQKIIPGSGGLGSLELIQEKLSLESAKCEAGEWGRLTENNNSSADKIYERYCMDESGDNLYGYQASMLLSGSQRTFLVTFIWTVSSKVPSKERSDSIEALSSETNRYLNSIRICDSPGYDPCQASVDQYLDQRAKEYLDNRI